MTGLESGALEYDEDGKLRVTDKGKAPEDRSTLDVTDSEAFESMMETAKGDVMDTIAAQQQPMPSPSPRIKPPTVETPDGQDIGPQPGPSPSPSPSPRIAPERTPKPEPEAPEPYKPDPNVSTEQDIKNRPPGTKGSPYLGPPEPKNTPKPELDITKPWGL